MPETIKVTLAGSDYTITVPLTLGQLEDVNVAVAGIELADPKAEMRRAMEQRREILAVALAPENPSLTAEALKGMRATRAELKAAVDLILEASGLIPSKESVPGEAGAGAA